MNTRWFDDLLNQIEEHGAKYSHEASRKAKRLMRTICINSGGLLEDSGSLNVGAGSETFARTHAQESLKDLLARYISCIYPDDKSVHRGFSEFDAAVVARLAPNDDSILKLLRDCIGWQRKKLVSSPFVPRPQDYDSLFAFQNIERAIDERQRATDCTHVKILLGEEYRNYVTSVIDKAERNLNISLSSVDVPTNRGHPAIPLFDALSRASSRNVQIHFWVQSSPLGMNDKQVRRLESRCERIGAKIVYLESKRACHFNIIVVDSDSAVAGSHSWAAGSLSSGADVSIAVESQPFAAECENYLVEVRDSAQRRSLMSRVLQ